MKLTSRKKKKKHGAQRRAISKTRKRTRDIDQVYQDFHKNPELPYDEDLKGCGQFKCFACDIYFINDDALKQHEKSKKHKRKVKLLQKEKPYTYKDALRAAEVTT